MNAKLINFSELSKQYDHDSSINSCLLRLYRRFNLNAAISGYGLEKKRGVAIGDLVLLLLLFRISGESIFQWFRNGYYDLFSVGKDCFYRLLNRPQMDWRRLLYNVATSFNRIVREKVQADEKSLSEVNEASNSGAAKGKKTKKATPRCFILDDSTLEKTGKAMEFIGLVFDHVRHTCVLGYKLLCLAYFDGKSTIAVDFTVQGEKGKNKDQGISAEQRKHRFQKRRDKDVPGYTRAQEYKKTKPEMALSMLRRAVHHKLQASYVLMDSWFVTRPMIEGIRGIAKGSLHVIGLHKMDQTKCEVKGKAYHIHDLILLHAQEAKTCRQLKSKYFTIRTKIGDTEVKLFFIQYGKQDNWHILLTTDMNLSFTDAFAYYQIRWSIEVLFADCKGYLRLGKYQGRDFDGLVADCTLAFITHTMLTLERRFSAYETPGEIFQRVKRSVVELTFWERFLPMIVDLIKILAKVAGMNFFDMVEAAIADPEACEFLKAILKALSPDNSTLNTFFTCVKTPENREMSMASGLK